MNWSTMIWAPLMKSPNGAAQHTSASEASELYPYSKPSAAYSDSGLLCSSNVALAPTRCWIGAHVFPVRGSWKTRWRWVKVPRSVSWPVSRTGMPPVISVAKASSSACAQSISRSASGVFRRSIWRSSLGCTVKPSGTASNCRFKDSSASAETAVLIYSWGMAPTGGRAADLGRMRGTRLDIRVGIGEASLSGLGARVRVVGAQEALFDELRGEDLSHRRMLFDRLVHLRLGVGGLVRFVVAEAPIADQVDDDVAPEL